MVPIFISGTAQSCSTSGTAATLTTSLDNTRELGAALYALSANQDIWFLQGSSPTASTGSGSTYLPAGSIVLLDGQQGSSVSVVQDAVAGTASITQVVPVR